MKASKRRVLICAATAVVLVGLALAARDSLECKLIFPGAATQGRSDAVVRASSAYELIPLRTRDGTRIVAQFGRALDSAGLPAATPERRPTVLFFYGNGSCVAFMSGEFERFRRLGVNVLMPEFPGYGMSEGQPSERGFYAAGDAAYDYLLTRPEVDPRQIVLAGWSMGAAVAIDLASRRPALALITVSAFTTLPAVAHALVPWLPASLILRSRFDNRTKIAAVSCPIFIAHGTRDGLVPPAMAAQLAAAARGPVITCQVTGAGHNDVFLVGGDALWGALGTFIRRQVPTQ
jgi:fermentation-respiration switch protein FrsA (DUF1100 family)